MWPKTRAQGLGEGAPVWGVMSGVLASRSEIEYEILVGAWVDGGENGASDIGPSRRAEDGRGRVRSRGWWHKALSVCDIVVLSAWLPITSQKYTEFL